MSKIKPIVLMAITIIFAMMVVLIASYYVNEKESQNETLIFLPEEQTEEEEPENSIEESRKTILTNYGEDPKVVWDMISKYSPNDNTTAAILGWFYRESKLKSNGVTGWPSCPNKHESEDFTAKVDAGLSDGSTKEYFVNQAANRYGGYGLGQFCSEPFLESLYDFAQEWGTSIGDAEMQCCYILTWIKEVDPWNMWWHICNEQDCYTLGMQVAKFIEGTALPESSASYAYDFYKKYNSENGELIK